MNGFEVVKQEPLSGFEVVDVSPITPTREQLMQSPDVLPNAEGTAFSPAPPFVDSIDSSGSFMKDTARIIGDTVTSAAAPIAKAGVGLVAGGAGLGQEAVNAGLATPESVKVGEAAIGALPFGVGTGLVISTLGKTALPAILTKTGKKIPGAIADFLFTASKSPVKVAAIEGAIATVSSGVDETVTQVTGSETAGTVAGVVTSIIAPARIAKHIMPAYLARESYVDNTLADYVRENPDILMKAESELAASTAAGLGVRLDLLTRDPSIAKMTKQLSEVSPDMANLYIKSQKALQDSLIKATDDITSGKLEASDAVKIVEDNIAEISRQRDLLVASLPSIDGSVEKISVDAFDKLIDSTYTTAKSTINDMYGKVSIETPLTTNDKSAILGLYKSLIREGTSSGIDVKKSGVRQIASALLAEAKAIGKKPSNAKTASVNAENLFMPSLSSINKIRGLALEAMRGRAKEGLNNDRLGEAVDGMTTLLEGHPELKAANEMYRAFKDVFSSGRISRYFTNDGTGKKIIGADSFAKDFLMGTRPIERIGELRKFVDSPFAKGNGIEWTDIQNLANDAFVAKLRSGDELNPGTWKRFITANKESLNQFGLTELFSRYTSVVSAVKESTDKLSERAINSLALAKFGFNDNPAALRNAINNNKVKALKEIRDVPPRFKTPARKAMLDSIIRDNNGGLLSPDKLNMAIKKHLVSLGFTGKHGRFLSSIAAHLDVKGAGGVTFNEFEAALKKDPNIFNRIKSVVLERITRTELKAIRATSFLKDVSSLRGIREDLSSALLTEDGARKILAIARKNPESATAMRFLLYGRAAALNNSRNSQQ